MITAPEFQVSEWLNTDGPVRLADLKGKVVIVHAFQMLCPACVHHAIPQAVKLHQKFARDPDVAVIGLHTVFEHHNAMNPEALKAFVEENKLEFPIGIDSPQEGKNIPKTMSAYRMQGTPTLILIDREGAIRAQTLGVPDDLDLGVAIGKLIAEPVTSQYRT